MSQPSEQKKRDISYAESATTTLNDEHPPTSYIETLMHLFKGNVGTGCYAMADAVKNGGIIVGPVLTLVIAIICVHAQHILIRCADFLRHKVQLEENPDFAEAVEICFANSTSERCRKMAKGMKKTCNIFICVTQLGFCCVYFLFIGKNVKNVLDYYGIVLEIHVLVTIILLPIWLSTLIRKLKYIGEFCNYFSLLFSYQHLTFF
jgi:proton-coupled amino acid transporter